jgi:nitronate monooxygenase
MVVEACKSGIVGSFPALNQRTSEGFEKWLQQITSDLEEYNAANPDNPAAPFGVNLIVHSSNPRMKEDLKLCVRYKVPLIITSLGAISEVIDAVHSYGGIVFHDVTNMRHAKKAAGAGVDGLILVCAGAGGHAGTLSPFAFLPEVRSFFEGTILLAGCISDGRSVAAARIMGADLAYIGTRFINVTESNANDYLQNMIIESAAADIVYTDELSGVYANFLRQSIVDAGLDPDNLKRKDEELKFEEEFTVDEEDAKAWRDIFSAGQGVGSIDDVPSVQELCARLKSEYEAAMNDAREMAQ